MDQVVTKSPRNNHIDFFRGLALLWIFIDHTPGDLLGRVTFQRFGACDALEVFILLAGCSASYAYGAALLRQGWGPASRKILRRVAVIYAANLTLLGALWAETIMLCHSVAGRRILHGMRLEPLLHVSLVNILAVLAFSYPMGLANLLRIYISLFLGLAAALPLLRFPRTLLALSAALYIVAYLFGLYVSRLPIGNAPMSPEPNLLAWQMALVIGIVMVREPSLRPRPRLIWDCGAAAVVAFALAMRIAIVLTHHGFQVPIPHVIPWGPIADWTMAAITRDGKNQLHPLRLANILAWTWIAYRCAPLLTGWHKQGWAKLFILCGRHSLPVFCVGAALAPLGGVWLAIRSGFVIQASYNIGGAVILILVAAFTAARRSGKRSLVVWRTSPAAAISAAVPEVVGELHVPVLSGD